MSAFVEDSHGVGSALTTLQQQWLEGLPPQPTWSQAASLIEIDIQGELEPQRLQQALDRLLERHAILSGRLAKVPGYRGVRVFMGDAAQRFGLTLPAPEAGAAALEAWLGRKFEVEGLPAAEGLLQRLADQRWRLVLGVAGFACDEAGLALLYRDLVALYAALPELSEAQPEAFEQYLEWRSEVVRDEDAPAARAYWQAHLDPQARRLQTPWLPYREEHPATGVSQQTLALPASLSDDLQRLADAEGRALPLLLQAAWWGLLSRLTGHRELLGGCLHDGREDYEYFADSVGHFSKVLPLSLHWDEGAALKDSLGVLGETLEQHTLWQEYWTPELAPSVLPVVLFAWAPQLPSRQVGGLHWQPRLACARLPAGVELRLQVQGDTQAVDRTLTLQLDYLDGRYSEAAIQGLLEQYRVWLQSLAQAPEQPLARLGLLGENERRRLLALNPAPLAIDSALLHERVAHWARETPQALALVGETGSLSYAELEAAVASMAAALQRAGVQPASTVALALPRSPEWVVAMLACWRAGAAYLALESHWPVARQARLMAQAQSTWVVTQEALLAEFREQGLSPLAIDSLRAPSTEALAVAPVHVEALAYVLFTSGSTGTPKGVGIRHDQLLNYVAGVCQALQLERCRHFAFSSTVSADLGHTALFGALYTGATLHVAADEVMKDAESFARFIGQHAIDCLKIVPSHLAALLESNAPKLPETLVLGGEATSRALVERLLQLRADCRVFNHYGPTETTVGVMVHPLSAAPSAAVGLSRVLPNNQVYVLNDDLQLAATGELGELYIGGIQRCNGYMFAAKDSDSAFIESPLTAGERLYRSGDLARYRPDGSIQLYGRRDHQVKVRGFRIELAEIEAQLLCAPHVVEAVMLCEAETLSGFVTLHKDAPADALERIKAHLAQQLPAVMLPRTLQVLRQLPRLANGKIDRRALQQQVSHQPTESLLAPRDALETLLAQRMAQLLGLEQVGVDQDFFALGGHSLLVIKLAAGIRKLLQCEINPGVIFDHPTVAGVAQVLREREALPGQLLKLAQARLRLDGMSAEEKARLLEKSR